MTSRKTSAWRRHNFVDALFAHQAARLGAYVSSSGNNSLMQRMSAQPLLPRPVRAGRRMLLAGAFLFSIAMVAACGSSSNSGGSQPAAKQAEGTDSSTLAGGAGGSASSSTTLPTKASEFKVRFFNDLINGTNPDRR